MKILAKCLGGSHLYGLNTITSDFDERGIYMHTDIDKIIGLNHNCETHWQDKSDGRDEERKELRSAIQLLRKGNSQVIELLFNKKWIEISPEWNKVIANRAQLVDSTVLFKCLLGYMQGEKHIAFGNGNTGKLGSKRKDLILKYQFSPKNVVQTLRLAFCGCWYFNTGFFPTDLREVDNNLAIFLRNVKIHPELHTKQSLFEMVENYEQELKKTFDNRRINTVFNDDLANSLILEFYLPVLRSAPTFFPCFQQPAAIHSGLEKK